MGSRETRDDEKPLMLAKLERADRPDALPEGFSRMEKLLRRLGEVLDADELRLAELLAVPVSKVAARSIMVNPGEGCPSRGAMYYCDSVNIRARDVTQESR